MSTETPGYYAAESKARDLLSGELDFGAELSDTDLERLHRLTLFILGVQSWPLIQKRSQRCT